MSVTSSKHKKISEPMQNRSPRLGSATCLGGFANTREVWYPTKPKEGGGRTTKGTKRRIEVQPKRSLYSCRTPAACRSEESLLPGSGCRGELRSGGEDGNSDSPMVRNLAIPQARVLDVRFLVERT